MKRTREEGKKLYAALVEPVEGSDCLRWRRAFNSEGYGVLRWNGIVVYAHRWAYWLFRGAVPEKKVICHSCDHRWCVNWQHLTAGTYGRNLSEAWHRRRRRCKPNTFLESNDGILTEDDDAIDLDRSVCRDRIADTSESSVVVHGTRGIRDRRNRRMAVQRSLNL